MNKLPDIRNNRGSILIVVLIFISLSVTVALTLHQKSVDSYASVNRLHAEYQSVIYAQTALEVIKSVLENDGDVYDSANDDWAKIQQIEFDAGSLSITITPLNNRIPLSMLLYTKDGSTGDTYRTRYEDALTTLFQEREITDFSWGILKDWFDNDSIPASGGEDDTDYTVNGKDFHTKSTTLTTLAELKLIPQVTQHYSTLKEIISIGEKNGESGSDMDTDKININFASAETIRALLPEIASYADDIVAHRATTPFINATKLLDVMDDDNAYRTIEKFVTAASSYFYAKMEVNINEESRYFHALLKRSSKRVTVLKYIEGANEDYF